MASLLLERDGELASLHALLSDTITGHGRIALIKGEAGIGKTTLVEGFLAQTQERRHDSIQSLWAACEALFTPRPLGPLYDIAQQSAAPLRALLEGEAQRSTIFTAVLDLLVQSPFILVIEDIHWADEATLDFIKYLARRIQRTTTLLILTYRDDEIGHNHPLRRVLGDLPARDVAGLQLRPLSKEAVATLELRAHRPIGRLHAITGGNAFFVVEALASDAPGAPATVSDAVLARIARRSSAARRLLELVAVAPNRIERWVIKALGAEDEGALDECLAAQMLRLDGQTITFRHELARRAVEGALSSVRRQTLHSQILHALLDQDGGETPLARLAHHAAVAEDAPLVLRFAPAAAQQAAAQGSHREAIDHYQTALHYANQMTSEQQAEMLDGLSNEYYLTGQIEEAIAPCEATLTLWCALDQQHKAGRTLRRLSRLSWSQGRNEEAERYGLEAVETLEALPPDRELAMAFANMAHLSTRTTDTAATLLWGERAIALAERLGDHETLTYALNSVGAAEIDSGDERGQPTLERSLEIALEHGYEEHVARAYGNLAICKVGFRHYDEAETYLREGIAYCAERDLDFWGHFLRWVQARKRMELGDWVGAEEDVTALLGVAWMAVTNRLPALLILGRIRARRGDGAAEALFDEASDLALSIGEPRRMEQVASARAEWRWLQGDLEGCAAEASVAIRPPYRITHPWYQSDVVNWVWRSGVLSEAPSGVLEPYALEISGNWRAAAGIWERLGCPWEQALALLQGDEAAQRAALAIFEQLGAMPAALISKRRLRERGARGLPRGPYTRTRANQQGLTNRQVEVLHLLAEGLRDVEIADRLSISRRTAEQHVGGVLMKLNARTRAEAVRHAYELGALP